VPALAPGLAAHDAVQGEIAALEGAVHFERLDRIDGAGRLETARLPEPGAQQQAIALHKADQQALHDDEGAEERAARASSCWSSARTAALSLSEEALTNSLRSKPARSRTTCAARGRPASGAALTV